MQSNISCLDHHVSSTSRVSCQLCMCHVSAITVMCHVQVTCLIHNDAKYHIQVLLILLAIHAKL